MSGRDEEMRTNPGVKFTYDDFLLFPDDGKRHELIDGEHYVTPSPSRRYQAIVWNLIVRIVTYLESNPVTIAVFRHVGEHYQRVLELAVERNDTLTTPLLPHLTLPLQQTFKD
jgi:Uma2 family endonuclease